MAKSEARVKFVADTKGFNDSIKKANSEIKLMSAELKLNAKEMSRTGENAESLEKKHELLENQLKASQDKTEALNQKIVKAVECFGENSNEVINLKTQLANAKTEQEKFREILDSCNEKLEEQRLVEEKLNSATNKLTDAIDKQENELSKLKQEYIEAILKYGDTSDEAKQLEQAIGDLSGELKQNKEALSSASKKADELDKSLDEVEDSAKDAGDGFTVMKGAAADLVADGISTLVGGIGDAVSGFMELSEETQEYREDLNKLKTAWESAGKSTELAIKTYKDFYSVLGEEDRSVEAINHLAKFVDTEEDMAKWTDICTGVWGTFGDSLPIEGLTEASNETVKTAQVTGVLADALNWASKEGETFGVKLKANTEKNEEWNKAVSEATKAEDFFNLALQECSSEQERQTLIMDTLEGLYKDSAKIYKENNKSIIASRKATSDYNDVLAEMGEELEPVNTELTSLKTSFLKGLAPVLKKSVIPAFKEFTSELEDNGVVEDFADITEDLAETAFPILADVISFTTENYKELAIGIGAAVVAFQTMSIVSTVTTAIQGATTAMGALNAVMAANPIGAIITVVGILAIGLVSLAQDTDDATESFSALTEEERELVTASEETAESFRKTKEAIEETNASITSEMNYTRDLSDELLSLADANGKVEEANQTRVQFILNELNEALGTEYTMVDGVIQNYEALEKSIYDVIDAKTANALLETKNEAYIKAIQAEEEALVAVNLTYKDYQEQLRVSEAAEAAYKEAYAQYQDKLAKCKKASDYDALESDAKKLNKLALNWYKERNQIDEKKKTYEDATSHYAGYINTINEYENAAMLVQEGNYQEAINMLKNKGSAYFEYSDNVSQATQDTIDALYKEAVNAGIEAERFKTNFENGVEGYTEEMVKEAEQGYEDALNKWANAYADAQSVGKDLSGGLENGMTSKKSSLLEKARSIISGIISAMRKEADSHSPSKKTIDFGEDLGEGTEIGLDNKTDDVVKSAENQVGKVMKAYDYDLTKPMISIGGFGELPIERNISSTLEQNLNNSSLASLISAVAELANRPIVLNVNDRTIAEVTASASDSVNGLRNTLIGRGLVLE